MVVIFYFINTHIFSHIFTYSQAARKVRILRIRKILNEVTTDLHILLGTEFSETLIGRAQWQLIWLRTHVVSFQGITFRRASTGAALKMPPRAVGMSLVNLEDKKSIG